MILGNSAPWQDMMKIQQLEQLGGRIWHSQTFPEWLPSGKPWTRSPFFVGIHDGKVGQTLLSPFPGGPIEKSQCPQCWKWIPRGKIISFCKVFEWFHFRLSIGDEIPRVESNDIFVLPVCLFLAAPGISWRGTKTTWCISWSSLSELCWGPWPTVECHVGRTSDSKAKGYSALSIVVLVVPKFRVGLTMDQWPVLDYWDAGTSKKRTTRENWASSKSWS